MSTSISTTLHLIEAHAGSNQDSIKLLVVSHTHTHKNKTLSSKENIKEYKSWHSLACSTCTKKEPHFAAWLYRSINHRYVFFLPLFLKDVVISSDIMAYWWARMNVSTISISYTILSHSKRRERTVIVYWNP